MPDTNETLSSNSLFHFTGSADYLTTIFKVLVLILLASNAFGQENEKLYPIPEGNLWGYIDQTGKTIIKPQFYAAGQFSEGLAPVRANGSYGYIDRAGTFVIPPIYDLALSFDHGQAAVFIASEPFIIDRKGNITFQHHYKSISTFRNSSFGIVVTPTNKHGVVNKNGELIIDTITADMKILIISRTVMRKLNGGNPSKLVPAGQTMRSSLMRPAKRDLFFLPENLSLTIIMRDFITMWPWSVFIQLMWTPSKNGHQGRARITWE